MKIGLEGLIEERAVIRTAVEIVAFAGSVVIEHIVAAAAIELHALEIIAVNLDAAGVEVAIASPHRQHVASVAANQVGEITAAVSRAHRDFVKPLGADAVSGAMKPYIRRAGVELISARGGVERGGGVCAGRGEHDDL